MRPRKRQKQRKGRQAQEEQDGENRSEIKRISHRKKETSWGGQKGLRLERPRNKQE